jgi:hypothetical protein
VANTATIEVCGDHNHGVLAPSAHAGLTEPQRKVVDPLLAAGRTPPSQVYQLIKSDPTLAPHPTEKQVRSYCKNNGTRVKEEGFDCTLAGFVDYGEQHKLDHGELDKVGCLGQHTNLDKKEFRFVFSTPRLLKMLLPMSQKLVGGQWALLRTTDGTYKLNRQGYPVITVGVVDAEQHFHIVAIAVCYSELKEDFAWVWEQLERTLKELDPSYDPAAR